MQVSIAQALEAALQLQRAGDAAQAEEIYRQVLAQQPQQPLALHLLGVIEEERGNSKIAEDLIRRSIAIDPAEPTAYGNLGNALQSQGRFEEAIAAYRQCLAEKP